MDKKSFIGFTLSQGESDMIKKASKELGLTISGYVRMSSLMYSKQILLQENSNQ